MEWRVELSSSAEKFLAKNHIPREEIFDLVARAVRYFSGEDININIGKLSGVWEGFYRIRKGKLRIIVGFDFHSAFARVEVVDWRGSAYK